MKNRYPHGSCHPLYHVQIPVTDRIVKKHHGANFSLLPSTGVCHLEWLHGLKSYPNPSVRGWLGPLLPSSSGSSTPEHMLQQKNQGEIHNSSCYPAPSVHGRQSQSRPPQCLRTTSSMPFSPVLQLCSLSKHRVVKAECHRGHKAVPRMLFPCSVFSSLYGPQRQEVSSTILWYVQGPESPITAREVTGVTLWCPMRNKMKIT